MLTLRSLLFAVGILIHTLSICQVTDDFSDGDFSDGMPFTWIPSQLSGGADFVISAGELQNSGPASQSLIYISTDMGVDLNNNDVTWSFNARYTGGSPSINNYIEVYIVSDKSDLLDGPSGYYIRMGENGSEDGIDFYSTTSGKIIDDSENLVSAILNVTIRITRTSTGMWTLEADNSGGTSFETIGSVQNLDHASGSNFGFLVNHSQTNNDNFFFDNVSVETTPVLDTTPPTVQSVTAVSATQLDVQFSENVDPTTSQVAGNYSLTGGISVTSAVQDADLRIVHLTTTPPFTNGANYILTVNNVQDESGNPIAANSQSDFQYLVIEDAEPGDVVINEFLADPSPATSFPEADFVELFNRSEKYIQLSGWTVKDNSVSGISDPLGSYVLEPNAYLIITDVDFVLGFESFGNVIGVDNFPNFNSTSEDAVIIRNNSDEILSEITYPSSLIEDGISLELINPNNPCISIDSYTPSTNPSGGTPGTQNSVFDDSPDTTPPAISSFGFTTSLIINFSEVMDATSLLSASYAASGLTIDQVIVEGEFPTSVEITFIESITLGETYELTLSDVEDCWGNGLEETTLTFGFGRSPSFNELLITEILFDEDPSVGLPEREFIEVFNASGDVISSEGVELIDATGSTTLPVFNLNPWEYKVLTSNSGASEFSNAVGVSSFPSLSNGGEQLILANANGLIFSITYNPEWHEESRSDGGYTLEMIDLTNPCVESGANWTSSINPSGGTPGAENSVNNPGSVPDNMPPSLIKATAISSGLLKLLFSEKLNPQSVSGITYSFSPEIDVQTSELLPESPNVIYVTLNTTLTENERYTLSVSNVTDCNGNEVSEDEVVFALPIVAIEGEILLSEVLFNPRTNGVDFVEIYNNSDNFITLKNWQLARLDEEGLDDQVILSEEELVLNPRDFLVFTEDPETLFNNYPKGASDKFFELTPFPTYSNDTGNVVLINAMGDVAEQFFYDEEFHYNLLESVDGVSLERVSYEESTNNPDNWRSASSTVGFATPGYENSQAFGTNAQAGKVTVDPKVFIPGNSGSGRDFTTINYQFDQPGKFANINIYDQTGRLVKNLAQGELLSTTGFLRWDGDTNGGNMARMGYYLILFEIYDSSGNSETIKETVVVGRDF
ncbi:MAG: lamin tail domain-containing protein [Ekhidna sp.]|uniref:lamin tail domain-containing protein n=1 Tax=Ekhidna sp. TaxID=2608089 RepID=UPI0032EB281B